MVQFSEQDQEVILREGLTEEGVLKQLDVFKRGVPHVNLLRPCTVGDGIVSIAGEKHSTLIEKFDRAAGDGRVMKFVPASGAATRMFKDWIGLLNGPADAEQVRQFMVDLPRYPFYKRLEKFISFEGENLQSLVSRRECKKILEYILGPYGLNYGSLPKALIAFHSYPDCARTSIEEHLMEAALYARDRQSLSRIHFTVSAEHEAQVREFLLESLEFYERLNVVRYIIGISTQLSSTNTIAADLENNPARDQEGRIMFRPGGHGALLPNLNLIDGDIIFVKNIDNVVKDALKPMTVHYKQLLGGCLIEIQERVFECLERISTNEAGPESLAQIAEFCSKILNISLPSNWAKLGTDMQRTFIIGKLNRPIRVCGMVRNEGEPGGGPFWVSNNGEESLQIIEEAQVDPASEQQRQIWASATHFNPVDLVCAVRDFRGKKFDLRAFVDEQRVFVSRKVQDGREIKALELPGLWNGSMSDWITVFVEEPIETFNPVKEVKDLLREQHQP